MAQDSGGKWTEGPWHVADDQVLSDGLNDYGNWYVCGIKRDLTTQDRANLTLIAAAPEMAGLLRLVADYQKSAWSGDAEAQRSAFAIEARAILARIEGE